MSRKGGSPALVFTSDDPLGAWIVADDEAAYVATRGFTTGSASVFRVPLAGGDPSDLTPASGRPELPYALTQFESDIYYTSETSSVRRIDKAGGGSVAAFSGDADKMQYAIAKEQSGLYMWLKEYLSPEGPRPYFLPTGAKEPVVLVDEPAQAFGGGPTLFAVDETSLYWLDASEERSLRRAPKSGGASVVIAQSVFAFALDQDSVYWVEPCGLFGCNVMRAPK